jgi:hypothetical protein
MASSHGVYDHSVDFVSLFSGGLHHLSCPRWREIFGIWRLARRGLLPDPGLARSSGICDLAAGDFHARSCFSSPMGPAQADCALDDPNLALRLYHRSVRVPDALQMVPSGHALSAVVSAVLSGLPGTRTSRCAEDSACYSRKVGNGPCQNLALGSDLMFHHIDAPRRIEIVW